jgi:porin
VFAQQDKTTDDEKPADPDTGESTVEESTIGLLPNPFERYGISLPRPTSVKGSAMSAADLSKASCMKAGLFSLLTSICKSSLV